MGRRNEVLWATWRERLERFRQSGLNVEAFCVQEKVSVPSYYQWKRRLSGGLDQKPKQRPASMTFVPIEIAPMSSIEVHLDSGARITIPTHAIEAIRVVIETVNRGSGEPRS